MEHSQEDVPQPFADHRHSQGRSAATGNGEDTGDVETECSPGALETTTRESGLPDAPATSPRASTPPAKDAPAEEALPSGTPLPTDAECDGHSSEHVPGLAEHDSLVTVRLSEPPALTVITSGNNSNRSSDQAGRTAAVKQELDTPNGSRNQRGTMPTVAEDDDGRSTISSSSSNSSSDEENAEAVDWDQLQRTEHEESNGQSAGNTAMLLARLEQENAKLDTNPKSVRVQSPEPPPVQQQAARRPRPPSMAQLRDMVHSPTPPALRYSMLPPPPLTDLEFYAALMQDYDQTAARLPTLLSNKIRKGIPPPLRGVVWQAMTRAMRDVALAEQFENYCGASSPYEGIIGKDLGRSFPGVDMFREPDGDGQRMLGRVLKSYSLHEPRIGYCQGLAFLVGPLLMHMPDKEAFCVLVKLMEKYDLRSSYMPDLAGLHVRIFQFRELLRSTLPDVSSHLEDLQVDPAAYVSQWFLSFFAVTCPLPMLFRMYDVVFAEGAAETIMRVALSLMQQNQARLLACAELEDAMQLLLSRSLWDCYHYNADEFVLHFLNFSNVVTRDRLASLDQAYREARIANINQTGSANVDRSSTIATVASRFLGRLWASSASSSSPASSPLSLPSLSSPTSATAGATAAPLSSSSNNNNPTLSSSLSNSPTPSSSSHPLASPTGASTPGKKFLGLGGPGPNAPPLRPLSMLQRSASKNSIASTVNSMEATSSAAGPSSSSTTSSSSSSSSSASSVLSSTSTEATLLSRDSSSELNALTKATAASSSGSNNSNNSSNKNGGKTNASDDSLNSQIEDLLTAFSDLQRQHALVTDQLQREREERSDDRKAVQMLLQNLREKTKTTTQTVALATTTRVTYGVQLRETDSSVAPLPPKPAATTALSISQNELLLLIEPVEARFGSDADNRRSSVPQSKSQLRDELARAKEQLSNELAKNQDHNRRVYETEQEVANMKEQLRESHAHARVLHQDKQRLERQIYDLRTRVASEAASAAVAAAAGAAHITNGGGGGDSNGPTAVAGGNAAATSSSAGGGMATVGSTALGIADAATEWFGRATGSGLGVAGVSGGKGGGAGGLRELKLGRSKSTPTQTSFPAASGGQNQPNGSASMSVFGGAGKRSSSLLIRGPGWRESVFNGAPANGGNGGSSNAMEQQQETLVLELVQAKTAEAVARQEAEEAKQRLESLRKALGLSPNDLSSMLHNASNTGGAASTAASAAMGMLGRLTTSISDNKAHAAGNKNAAAQGLSASTATATTTTTAPSSGYGSFFGWRR
ncbi:GTPase activating protein [Niveomyces insectorum RCEF 264]|uniref:GTPase activating protein n=1 Tax=Niveomyces insectorum RCEF 264 TaxID=1081102 RepID=A0A162MED9_9HYPO|nr:GTPase activating protein [Niveomyces insectorum RCEF 264]